MPCSTEKRRRSRGETGLSRESLYKAPAADGKPAFDTVYRVLRALGLELSVKPAAPTPR